MKKVNIIITSVVLLLLFVMESCETSNDISFGLDHAVPSYEVLTDSMVVSPLDEVQLKIRIADESGLLKLKFSYSAWAIEENIELKENGFPLEYVFERTIVVPADAKKQWDETIYLNDGSSQVIKQQYHRLIISATDTKQNTRDVIPVYIKVQ